MILTITSTSPPATDLGYLLHKNPDRLQTFEFGWGNAHVFYPEASEERCTAALLLEIDPISLVRRGPRSAFPLAQYVNDRPYVASSFLSVAIAKVFSTALRGRSRERPELAQTPLVIEATVAALPCRGGEDLARRLFGPLGYAISTRPQPLDAQFPDWGCSEYLTVTIRGQVRLSDLLTHLYVLIPVLDDQKHYWVAAPEIDKLLARGTTWLAGHPERHLVARRYLKHQRHLVDEALTRLAEEDAPELTAVAGEGSGERASIEVDESLRDQRIAAVVAALKECRAQRVLDLGCGSGLLLAALLADPSFTDIVGMDVSCRALTRASDRLRLDRMAPRKRERLSLIQGSLTYRDRRLAGYDAAVLMEVIEHIDLSRLNAFEYVLFGCARPRAVILTTPNADYNALFTSLPAATFRDQDHRFEWSREELATWADRVAQEHGYSVGYRSIGDEHPMRGGPTQMAVFVR